MDTTVELIAVYGVGALICVAILVAFADAFLGIKIGKWAPRLHLLAGGLFAIVIVWQAWISSHWLIAAAITVVGVYTIIMIVSILIADDTEGKDVGTDTIDDHSGGDV